VKPRPHPIRSLLKQLPLYAGLKQLGHAPDYWWWKLRGEPRRIPHIVKQRAVLDYARAFGLTTLVETGTYYGEMIAAVAPRFRRVYSIEIDPHLAALAHERFRRFPHVTILESDSQTAVPQLLAQLDEACLWWLDAGYCGWAGAAGKSDRLGSEFEAILADREHSHVILMDDADGVAGLSGLLAAIQSNHPDRQVEVAHNIIRITPRWN
jgi:hypothetical protein